MAQDALHVFIFFLQVGCSVLCDTEKTTTKNKPEVAVGVEERDFHPRDHAATLQDGG